MERPRPVPSPAAASIQCIILPATSQRARYSQASLSVSNLLTRPFSYAICPFQNALNAPFTERSTLLVWVLFSLIMKGLLVSIFWLRLRWLNVNDCPAVIAGESIVSGRQFIGLGGLHCHVANRARSHNNCRRNQRSQWSYLVGITISVRAWLRAEVCKKKGAMADCHQRDLKHLQTAKYSSQRSSR